MLICQNSKSCFAAVWRHNAGRSLHVLKAEVWWGSSGITLRMVWEAEEDPRHSEEATRVLQTPWGGCWHCSYNHPQGSSTKHKEILVSLRKSGAWCSGNTQPWCAGWTHMPIFATGPVNHQPCYCASTPLVCWLNENYPWFWLFLIWLSLVRQIRN